MKKGILLVALAVGIGTVASADLTFVSGTTVDTDTAILWVGINSFDTAPAPPSSRANLYWDADKDGVLGETGIGENTGNDIELGINFTVVDGETYHFVVNGWALSGTAMFDFYVQKTDSSLELLSVTEGTPTTFFDGAQEWSAEYVYTAGGLGVDAVGGVFVGADGTGPDHLGQLTFEAIPEPATMGLVAVFGGGILFVRRKLGI